MGSHTVKIEKSGYATKTYNYISQENRTKLLECNLKRKTKMSALWRSIIMPGWGQHYQEKSARGWLYPIFFIGSAAGSYLMVNNYNTAVKDYKEARALYKTAYGESDIGSKWAAMEKAYDDIEPKENTRNMLFIATGAIWLWNVLDTVILPLGYKNKMTFSAKSVDDKILAGVSLSF